jgi:predicted nucleic acid-binding protein
VIVVDTSVWIAAMRQPASVLAETLRRVIDADEACLALPVRMELLAGVAAKDRTALRRGLQALPVVAPTEDTRRLAESWIEPAANAGHRFATTDLLIAGMADEIGALIWSLDSDFTRLESLGYVRLYEPNPR